MCVDAKSAVCEFCNRTSCANYWAQTDKILGDNKSWLRTDQCALDMRESGGGLGCYASSDSTPQGSGRKEVKTQRYETNGMNRPKYGVQQLEQVEQCLVTPVGLERVVRLEARVAAGFLRSDVDGVVRVVQDGVHRITAGGQGGHTIKHQHSTSRKAHPCA